MTGVILHGVLYQWCVGCSHMKEIPRSCPADFIPFDSDACLKLNGHDPPENYREFKRREQENQRVIR